MYNLEQAMRRAGFEAEQTGGGCVGFCLKIRSNGSRTGSYRDAAVEFTIADHGTSIAAHPADAAWGVARGEDGGTETLVSGVPLAEAVRAVADAIEGMHAEAEVRDLAGWLWERTGRRGA